jgi:hypothetical protein
MAVLQKLTGEHEGRETSLLFSLGCHSKQAGDERNLTGDVPFFHTMHLPPPNRGPDIFTPRIPATKLFR